MLVVQDLTVVLGGKTILRNVNVSVQEGEVLAILGRNGCGKTTLLSAIAGDVDVTSGSVANADSVAYSTQNAELLPWRTVFQNVRLPFELQGVVSPEVDLKVEAILGQVGLLEVKQMSPSELSGGTAQKVAIARTLCSSARLFLFDEPFASMDVVSWPTFGELIRARAVLERACVVLVTHQLEAALMADRVVVLSGTPTTDGKTFEVIESRIQDGKGPLGVAESISVLHEAFATSSGG